MVPLQQTIGLCLIVDSCMPPRGFWMDRFLVVIAIHKLFVDIHLHEVAVNTDISNRAFLGDNFIPDKEPIR